MTSSTNLTNAEDETVAVAEFWLGLEAHQMSRTPGPTGQKNRPSKTHAKTHVKNPKPSVFVGGVCQI